MVLSVVTTNQCLCNKNVYITTNHSCTSCVQVQNLSVCLCYGQLKATFQQTITLYTRSHVCSANYVYLPWIFTIWSHCPEIFFFFEFEDRNFPPHSRPYIMLHNSFLWMVATGIQYPKLYLLPKSGGDQSDCSTQVGAYKLLQITLQTSWPWSQLYIGVSAPWQV